MREGNAEVALRREAEAARDLLIEIQAGDDETLAHDMVEGETGLLEAIDKALDEMVECDVLIGGLDKKLEELKTRKLFVEQRKQRIKGAIEQAMARAELSTARRAAATLSLRKVKPKPIIVNESEIPSEFWKPQDPKLDKAAVTKAAKERSIPGVEMDNGSISLAIRTA